MISRSCLADTLKFEADASTQVNTLESEIKQVKSGYASSEPSPGSVTRQQAYSAELDATMAELARLLDQLETTKHPSNLQLVCNPTCYSNYWFYFFLMHFCFYVLLFSFFKFNALIAKKILPIHIMTYIIIPPFNSAHLLFYSSPELSSTE